MARRSTPNDFGGILNMKHIKTVAKRSLKDTLVTGGCGECQTSCQSACKTSCTLANQQCERKAK
jgi:predicted ribosomally synthesized six-cysteine peptide SCIFF